MYKAFIFDLSEVLLRGLLGIEVQLAKIISGNTSEILNYFRKNGLDDFFRGKISEDLYLSNVIKSAEWDVSLAELKKIIRKNFCEISGTRQIIQSLRATGYQLVLLSVHGKEWIEFCEKKHKFMELFDSCHFSFQQSYCKPEENSFIQVLETLKLSPRECIFVDDSLKNIEVAVKLGMCGVHFLGSENLAKKIKGLGIKLQGKKTPFQGQKPKTF